VANPINASDKVKVDGKFFRSASGKFYVKGITYGPFAPNSNGEMFRFTGANRPRFQTHQRARGECFARLLRAAPLAVGPRGRAWLESARGRSLAEASVLHGFKTGAGGRETNRS
jgi:hypothetical protein